VRKIKINISGPSGSTTVPSVDFVEDPNNLLPDVLDVYDESFNANWDDIEARLDKLKKFSEDHLTEKKKRDFENQVERVQAVTKVIQTKEKLVLNPRNKNVRELIKRSSVRTLKDGTEVLMFRSEQGINKSGTQIMKRGKTSVPTYSKDSIALREYKELVRKIRDEPNNSDTVVEGRGVELNDPSGDRDGAEEFELVDVNSLTDDIPGLTESENRELRGVLNPDESADLRARVGNGGVLQVQASFFQEVIDETLDLQADMLQGEVSRLVGEISAERDAEEYEKLRQRIGALREARDRTLDQKDIEAARVEQLNDVSRFRRFVKLLGREKVGVAGVLTTVAGIITTIIVYVRKAVVSAAKATSRVAKALANIAKKGAPILVPVLNTIAAALSWGARGIAWLASHLWVLAIAAALMVYNYYTR
jgi:hypothetical protein